MNSDILKSIILNIGLLVFIAQIIARIRFVKKYILHDRYKVKEQNILICLFGTVCVISNYTGYRLDGAYANTRVIGVIAAA